MTVLYHVPTPVRLQPQPSNPCKVTVPGPAEQQLCNAIWKDRWLCQAPRSESLGRAGMQAAV